MSFVEGHEVGGANELVIAIVDLIVDGDIVAPAISYPKNTAPPHRPSLFSWCPTVHHGHPPCLHTVPSPAATPLVADDTPLHILIHLIAVQPPPVENGVGVSDREGDLLRHFGTDHRHTFHISNLDPPAASIDLGSFAEGVNMNTCAA